MLITKDQAKAAKSAPGPLGEAVYRRREALGISQRTAAAKIGISQSTVARVERGQRPSMANLIVILQWLADTKWAEERA